MDSVWSLRLPLGSSSDSSVLDDRVESCEGELGMWLPVDLLPLLEEPSSRWLACDRPFAPLSLPLLASGAERALPSALSSLVPELDGLAHGSKVSESSESEPSAESAAVGERCVPLIGGTEANAFLAVICVATFPGLREHEQVEGSSSAQSFMQ